MAKAIKLVQQVAKTLAEYRKLLKLTCCFGYSNTQCLPQITQSVAEVADGDDETEYMVLFVTPIFDLKLWGLCSNNR